VSPCIAIICIWIAVGVYDDTSVWLDVISRVNQRVTRPTTSDHIFEPCELNRTTVACGIAGLEIERRRCAVGLTHATQGQQDQEDQSF
jgi:hypothetical protein